MLTANVLGKVFQLDLCRVPTPIKDGRDGCGRVNLSLSSKGFSVLHVFPLEVDTNLRNKTRDKMFEYLIRPCKNWPSPPLEEKESCSPRQGTSSFVCDRKKMPR